MTLFQGAVDEQLSAPPQPQRTALAALAAAGAFAVVAHAAFQRQADGPAAAVLAGSIYLAMVLAVAGVGGWWALRDLGRIDPGASRTLLYRLLAVAVWAPPFVLLCVQGSWAALVAAAAGGVAGAEAFRAMQEQFEGPDEEDEPPKGLLLPLEASQNTIDRARAARVAAVGIYLSVLFACDGRMAWAGTLFGGTCALVAWYGLGSPSRTASGERSSHRLAKRIALGLLVTILALLPQAGGLLGGAGPDDADPRTRAALANLRAEYSSVILTAEPQAEPSLPSPPRPRPDSFRVAPADSVASIPFTGEYWFFFRPMRRPDPDALRKPGSPLTLRYRSVDQSGLVMEANQPLDAPLALSCCGAIDLVLLGWETEPSTIGLELVLIDSTHTRNRAVSLGAQALTDPFRPPVRLRFPVPAGASIQQFDQIRVRFLLDDSREERSASLSISRFELVR
ncbi:MAG: hypothetical protein GC160_06880 [Acidobacteria bacterium]|nr:hypothetical protein [Acidobacteriota bacterium]